MCQMIQLFFSSVASHALHRAECSNFCVVKCIILFSYGFYLYAFLRKITPTQDYAIIPFSFVLLILWLPVLPLTLWFMLYIFWHKAVSGLGTSCWSCQLHVRVTSATLGPATKGGHPPALAGAVPTWLAGDSIFIHATVRGVGLSLFSCSLFCFLDLFWFQHPIALISVA